MSKSSKVKFIPYTKLSKRKKRELNEEKRVVWDGFSPVTRVVKNKKAYDRKRDGKRIDTDE